MKETINSEINPMMLASKTFDAILNMIQKSNLNFALHLSPFSANISLKKSFIKNKSGLELIPPQFTSHEQIEKEELIATLVAKNLELENNVRSLENNLKAATDDCEHAYERIKCLEEQLIRNDFIELKKENDTLKSKVTDIVKKNEELESKVRILSGNLYDTKMELENKHINEKNRVENLETKLADKEVELKEVTEEKNKLEKKVNDLLDVLYGCPECGCNSCECTEPVEGDDYTFPSALPPVTFHSETCTESLLLPPSQRIISPWTPPPTPPCSTCGGINFGPSPGEVCFNCIPPIQATLQARESSPSRTPPGTPPLLRK